MKYGYKIEHKGYTDVTREADPDDSWDRDDLSTSWDISNNILETDTQFPDIVSSKKLDFEKEYFLVYVIFSTGDSFHHHSGYDCRLIDVFEHKENAQKLVEMIEKQNENYQSNQRDLGENAYSMTYTDESGETKQISCDWNGYFERIDSCDIKTVTLQLQNIKKSKYKK